MDGKINLPGNYTKIPKVAVVHHVSYKQYN